MGQRKEQRRAAEKLAKKERKQQKRELEAQAKIDSKTQERIEELKKSLELAQSQAAFAVALGEVDEKVLGAFQFKSSGARDLARETIGRKLQRGADGTLTINGRPFVEAGKEIILATFAPLLGTPPLNRAPVKPKVVDLEDLGDLSVRIDPQTGNVVVGAAPGAASAAAKKLADALLLEGWADRLTAAPEDAPARNEKAEELAKMLGKEQRDEEAAAAAALTENFTRTDFNSFDASTPDAELKAACRSVAEALKKTHQD
jgi:hypothetical protein